MLRELETGSTAITGLPEIDSQFLSLEHRRNLPQESFQWPMYSR